MGADRFKVLCSRDSLFPSAHIPTLFHAMRTGEPYPIKAFLIFGNNGLVTYGNSRDVYDCFRSLEFLSVMDIYMTPTAEVADIILPAATWLEVDQVVGVAFVANNVALVQLLPGDLLSRRQNRFGPPQVDQHVAVVDLLNESRDHLPQLLGEILMNLLALGLANPLNDDLLGGLVQVPGARIITQSLPQFQDRIEPGPGQSLDGWETLEKPVIVRLNGIDLRLLEHDFRDPYGVRIFGPSPG